MLDDVRLNTFAIRSQSARVCSASFSAEAEVRSAAAHPAVQQNGVEMLELEFTPDAEDDLSELPRGAVHIFGRLLGCVQAGAFPVVTQPVFSDEEVLEECSEFIVEDDEHTYRLYFTTALPGRVVVLGILKKEGSVLHD